MSLPRRLLFETKTDVLTEQRYTYPGAWINSFVAGGLIYLHYNKKENWTSGWHTYLPITLVFLLSNVFLVIVPFIPPDGDWDADGYPYYVFPTYEVAPHDLDELGAAAAGHGIAFIDR